MSRNLDVQLPNAEFSAAVRDGTAEAKLTRIIESSKPEAVYFTEEDGHRSALLVVDVANSSLIPSLVEPWFLTFNADVRCRIAMTPAELRESGISEIGKRW